MSLISKFQSLFTEEVEEPIKSEVIQVEIPAPEAVEENVSDNQTIKIEEKTPVFFNDDDFKELEKPKEIKSSYIKEKPVIKKEEKKTFRPTPIISPVWGVLDKNYHKEDITDKKSKNTNNTASLNLDEVRRKAYGTLETDLEDTLFGSKSILFNDEIEKEEPPVAEDDLLEDLTDVIDFDDDNLSDEKITEVNNKDDKMNSEDLFDLIDSMYERGE